MIRFVDEEQGIGFDLVAETGTFFSETGLLSQAKNFECFSSEEQFSV